MMPEVSPFDAWSKAKLTASIEPRTDGGHNQAAVRKAAEEFESIFIHQFLEHMWSGVETDGPFAGGQSEQIFRSIMNEEVAKQISQSGGLGLADNIMREILALQEKATA